MGMRARRVSRRKNQGRARVRSQAEMCIRDRATAALDKALVDPTAAPVVKKAATELKMEIGRAKAAEKK